MNNKGFTLVELIVTIGLIALLSVTVGISMNGMLSRQKDSEVYEYIKKIEKAACAYMIIKYPDSTTNTTVTIDDLIKEGLLSKKDKNPCSGDSIETYSGNSVTITFDSGERKCEYKSISAAEKNCKTG